MPVLDLVSCPLPTNLNWKTAPTVHTILFEVGIKGGSMLFGEIDQ